MKLPRLIGVIQLGPLGGAPKGSAHHPAELLQNAGLAALREARLLARAGFDGILLQNHGDSPYFTDQVPPETIASMAIVAAAVREAVTIQVGLHVLKNDAFAALAIAAVTGCDFIRVGFSKNDLSTSCYGRVPPLEPAFLFREKERLGAPIAILADLGSDEIEALSLDQAEGRIISGRIPPATLRLMSQFARENNVPLYLSDGVSLDKLFEIHAWVDGLIVDSALRTGHAISRKLDFKKARGFARQLKQEVNAKSKKKLRKSSP